MKYRVTAIETVRRVCEVDAEDEMDAIDLAAETETTDTTEQRDIVKVEELDAREVALLDHPPAGGGMTAPALDAVRAALAAHSEAVIDTVARILVPLGATKEWTMEDNFHATETIAELAAKVGLPPATVQDPEPHRWWAVVAHETGDYTDYEWPDETLQDSDEVYEKCAMCHLFVEPNDAAFDDQGNRIADPQPLAEYLHLHRGTPEDEKIDNDHEARPSGLRASLSAWREFGPPEMRARFVDA